MNYARTHRSCADAFGPYNASHECTIVTLPDGPMDWQDKIVLIGCTLAAVGLACMAALGWLA